MSGIGNFFNRNQQPLETSGEVTLKKGVTKDNFVKKVESSLDDGILTKSEYKKIKDSMVGGREGLNNILSQVGIADLKQLDTIFGKGKEHGFVNITPNQKQELKSLLAGQGKSTSNEPVNLTLDETQIRDRIVSKDLSVDRSVLTNRYSMNDFIFSPEVSGIFKSHAEKEYSSENINFLVDTKKTLANPTKEGLTNLYNKYIKEGSEGYININSRNRKNCNDIFKEGNNSSLSNMMSALESPVKEIKSITGDTFSRFSRGNGISQAIINEAVYLPAGNQRQNYINSIISSHQDLINKSSDTNKSTSNSSSMISYAKKALGMTAKVLGEIDFSHV